MIKGLSSLHTNRHKHLVYHLVRTQYGIIPDYVRNVVSGLNSVFEITSGGNKLYAKIFRYGRVREDIENEISVILALPFSSRSSVAKPLRQQNGAYTEEVAPGRYACVFEEAPGDQIPLEAKALTGFGGAIAMLQGALNESTSPPAVKHFSAVTIVKDAIQELHSNRFVSLGLITTLESLQETFTLLDHVPWSWCHGDARFENARVEGEKTTFFDLEDLFFGPRMFDLAKVRWCLEFHNPPNLADLWAASCRGYDNVYQISPTERDSLEPLVCLNEVRSLLFLARHCDLEPAVWEMVERRSHAIFARLG